MAKTPVLRNLFWWVYQEQAFFIPAAVRLCYEINESAALSEYSATALPAVTEARIGSALRFGQ